MNLFKLVATVGLDTTEYDAGVDRTVEKGKGLSAHLGGIMSGATKIVAEGIGAAATGVATLTGLAVKGYADYEQLVGGVETLFGTGGKDLDAYAKSVGKTVDDARVEFSRLEIAQGEVLQNAEEAYKTAGMSVNEYMETVTGFSASLISSMGGDTVAAAQKSNKAIIDMSDNANKMGTDISMIQNAYQGFAKQNYTMLDNLKLGYGGTKGEMERLLEKANEINEANGEHTEYQIENYADIVDAIHVVQEEMGINGTTQAEAAETISGSIGMMKSSWHNLVIGMADDGADIDKLMGNFTDSLGAVAENILPRVKIALTGAGEFVEEFVPELIEEIPGFVDDVLPDLLESGGNVIFSIADGIYDNFDTLLDSGFDIVHTLMDGVSDHADEIQKAIPEVIGKIGDKIVEDGPDIAIEGGIILGKIAVGFVDAIPEIAGKIPELIKGLGQSIYDHREEIKELGVSLAKSIAGGMVSILETVGLIPSWGVNYYDQLEDMASKANSNSAGSGRPHNPNPSYRPSRPNDPYRGVDGSYATGLDYVPFDGFIAELHQGERVLTAQEAQQSNSTTFGDIYITIEGGRYNDPDELAEAIDEKLEELRERRGLGE